jgi:hypothetical protein
MRTFATGGSFGPGTPTVRGSGQLFEPPDRVGGGLSHRDGVALGLGFSFVLIADISALAALMAHGSEPRPTAIVVVSCLTLDFGVGTTLNLEPAPAVRPEVYSEGWMPKAGWRSQITARKCYENVTLAANLRLSNVHSAEFNTWASETG